MTQTRLTQTIAAMSLSLLCVLPFWQVIAVNAVEPATLSIDYDPGELMSIIAIDPKSGDTANAVRRDYLREAFDLASEFGLHPMGSLTVNKVIIGKFKPSAVAFYSWPSAEAEARFNDDPRWTPIKVKRPEGWDELRIHDLVSEGTRRLVFSSDKYYTLATAWVNPERPQDYESYLANVEAAVNAAGGRFVYEMRRPNFSSLIGGTAAPSRLTFVEWDESESLDRFLASDSFERHSPLLYAGTTGFELLGLRVRSER